MKKPLPLATIFALAIFLAGCAQTSCPPATFIPGTMKVVEATEHPPIRTMIFKVPAGTPRSDVWRKAVEAYQPDFNSDVVDLEAGLITTEWRYYTHSDSSGFTGAYRVRLVILLKGKNFSTIEISSPATWRQNIEDPKTAQNGHDGVAMETYYRALAKAFAK